MGYLVRMPKLGLEMEMGVVVEWKVDVGDAVEDGDVLVEVESEKSIGEVEAREEGTLRRVYVDEDGEVPPGTPIGIVAAPGADVSDLEAEAEAELAEEAPDVVATGEAEAGADGDAEAGSDGEAVADADSGAVGDAATASDGTDPEGRSTVDDDSASGDSSAGGDASDVKASPRARKRAGELDVELAGIEGTGFDGAVTEEDVEAAAESGDAGGTTAAGKASPRARRRAEELNVDLTTVEGTGFDGAVTEEDVEAAAESEPPPAAETTTPSEPASTPGVRRITQPSDLAARYEWTTAVADPSAGEALLGTVEAVRTAFEERASMSDVLLVVASAALADEPAVNGTYVESTHQVQGTQNVALVQEGDGDPVATIVSDVGNRSLSEVIEARRNAGGDDDSTQRATFVLSNAAENDATGPLVSPPAVAALEVDPTGRRAVPAGDGVDLQPLVTARLTYDTRAIGAVEASAFLDRFVERADGASSLVLESYRGTE